MRSVIAERVRRSAHPGGSLGRREGVAGSDRVVQPVELKLFVTPLVIRGYPCYSLRLR